METPEGKGSIKYSYQTHGPKLPTKTRIAAHWIILVGVVGTIVMIVRFGFSYGTWESSMGSGAFFAIFFLTLLCIALGALYLLPAIFLRKRKRWAWIYAVSTLCVAIIPLIGLTIVEAIRPHLLAGENSLYYYIAGIIICLVPMILLFIDVKNYWEITNKTVNNTSKSTTEIGQ